MKYITGIHALNIECKLDTCGDWHTSALDWNNIKFKESDESILGDYGIEVDKYIPEHDGAMCVANHIRALLDMIADENFGSAQGMRADFICNDKYNCEIFDMACKIMQNSAEDKAKRIQEFMCREYGLDWINYRGG